MIYLINDDHLRTKIGYTAEHVGAEKRITNMRTGNASNLKIFKVFQGDRSQEKKLHKLFKRNNVRGEWFYGEPRDYWYSNAIKLLEMDGPNILECDISEIDKFVFIPELAAKGVTVLNLKALMMGKK